MEDNNDIKVGSIHANKIESGVKMNRENRGSIPDFRLMILGVIFLLLPLFIIMFAPSSYEKAIFYLRVITALGGALVGASLPGILHVDLPFARAGGALAMFLLIYAVDPPKQTIEAMNIPDDPTLVVTRHDQLPQNKDQTLMSDIDSPPKGFNKNTNVVEVINGDLKVNLETSGDIKQSFNSTENQNSAHIEQILPLIIQDQIMPLSWVKPSNFLGWHYHIKIDDNVFLWPTKLDSVTEEATIIINSSNSSRVEGKTFISDKPIKIGMELPFKANGFSYILKLVSIRKAGSLDTYAGFFEASRIK